MAILCDQDIDFGKDEHECEYKDVQEDLLQRILYQQTQGEEESDAKMSSSSKSTEKEDSTKSMSTEKKESTTSEGSEEEEEEEEDSETTMREKMVFKIATEYEMLMRLPGTSVYKMKSLKKDPEDSQLYCLKICKRKKNRIPMELRVLSHIWKIHHCYLQEMLAYQLESRSYCFISRFIPALPDIEGYTDWNKRPARIQAVMRQLLIGLAALHAHGVIHRDIKPSNLLWDESKECLVIADFGLATWQTGKKNHHILTGTDGFIAPEVQAFERDGSPQGPQGYDRKCDSYSAGMVFACMLFAYSESDMKEFYAPILRECASKLLPEVAELLTGLICFDQEKRLTATQALKLPYFQLDLANKVSVFQK